MRDIVSILKEAGAVFEGQFIGTSGRHLALYINKDSILPKTLIVAEIGEMFAELNKDKDIDVVAAPAVAAIPFSQWTAYHLSKITGKEVLSVFTEKTDDNGQKFTAKRSYAKLVKGKNILVVEDVATTGGSVKKTIDAVVQAGGTVVQVSLMINRDPESIHSAFMGFPLNELGTLSAESWGEDEVPDWLKEMLSKTAGGIPISVNTSIFCVAVLELDMNRLIGSRHADQNAVKRAFLCKRTEFLRLWKVYTRKLNNLRSLIRTLVDITTCIVVSE